MIFLKWNSRIGVEEYSGDNSSNTTGKDMKNKGKLAYSTNVESEEDNKVFGLWVYYLKGIYKFLKFNISVTHSITPLVVWNWYWTSKHQITSLVWKGWNDVKFWPYSKRLNRIQVDVGSRSIWCCEIHSKNLLPFHMCWCETYI